MVREITDPEIIIPDDVKRIIEMHKPFHYCIGVGDDYQTRMFVPIPVPEGHAPTEIWYNQIMEVIVGGNHGISVDNEVVQTDVGNFQYGGELNSTVKYLSESGYNLIDLSWLP